MTPALLGKKIGMTRMYDEKGAVVPVTVVQAGPCACHAGEDRSRATATFAVQLGYGDASRSSARFR